MFRKVLFSLLGFALVLLFDSLSMPANATVPSADVYHWGYANFSSSQQVCHKIVFRPNGQVAPAASERKPVRIESEIVDRRYCAHLPKATS